MADDSLSDEDKALFRSQMRTVKPLQDKTPKDKSAAPKIAPPKRPHQEPIPKTTTDYYLSDYICNHVLSESTLSYSHPSLPTKRFRELRHGEIAWEARLDLHGMKADDAKERLCRFVQQQIQGYSRCVLIIHGKGGHQGAPPVIKNLVNRWLPQLDEVLAFHSAQPKDGGHGAVYVLLKRNREINPEKD